MKKILRLFSFLFFFFFGIVPSIIGQDIISNLVADYPFCGNASDYSGNGHDGTVHGAKLTWDRFGHPGSAYDFNGIDNWIETSWTGILGSQARTISFWARVPVYNNPMYAISYGDTTRGNGFDCNFDIGTTVEAAAFNVDKGYVLYSTVVGDTSWHHWAWVVPNKASPTLIEGVIYRDGQLLTNPIFYWNGYPWCQQTYISTTANMFLFTIGRYVSGFDYFRGTLDDIRIYDRALTYGDIQALLHYQSTCGLNIYTESLQSNTYCAGSSFPLLYRTSGPFYNTNVFSAQLSDSTGSFAYPLVIGNRVDSLTDTIFVVIPKNVPPGTKYRIRVVGSDPPIVGVNNGADVTIAAAPYADAGKDTTICKGNPVVIGRPATHGSPPYRYSWSPATHVSDISIAQPTVYPDTTTSYFLQVTDVNGCMGFDTIHITVHPMPFADAGLDTSICAGSVIALGNMLNGSSWPCVYKWTPPDGLNLSNIAMPTAKPAKTTRYYLTVSDPIGCSSYDSITVTVVAHSQVKIVANGPTTFCEGDSLRLSLASSTAGQYWSTGDTVPSIYVRQGGKYTVNTLNAYGCVDTDTLTVNVLPNRAVVVTSGPVEFCDGDSVRLSFVGLFKTKRWSTGDTSMSILVKKSGAYTITVTNQNGCIAVSRPVIVTVHDKLTPTIVPGGSQQLCDGDSLTLRAGENYASYQWTTGSQADRIVVKYPGTYGLVVSDAFGCNAVAQYVVSRARRPSVMILGAQSVCVNNVTTYHAPTGKELSYSWTIEKGAALNGVHGDSIRIRWDTAGTARIMLSVQSDTSGCTEDTTIFINIGSSLTPVITANRKTTICQGDSVTLDAGSGYASYEWSTGDHTQTITVSHSAVYSVGVWNESGCSGVSQPVEVRVVVPPQPAIAGADVICEGDSIALDADGGYTTYLWSTGETTRMITVRKDGLYSVTVVDTNGCSGVSAEKAVQFLPAPLAGIEGARSVCKESDGMYSVPMTAGATYTWSVAGGAIVSGSGTNGIHVRWGGTGSGSVQITVKSAGGCSKDSSIEVQIEALLHPEITLLGDTNICRGGSLSLSGEAGYGSYLWSTGDTTRDITVTNAGVYVLSVTSTGGCSGTSDAIGVRVYDKPDPRLNGESSVCINAEAGYSVVADTANVYIWSVGSGAIIAGAGTNSVRIVWTSGGFDTVRVHLRNRYGCVADTMMIVEISNTLHPRVLVRGATTLCAGDSVVLDAGSGYGAYLWNTGAVTQTISVRNSGAYYASVQDAGGCHGASDTIQVTVHTPPAPVITGAVRICPQDSTTLNAGSGYSSYLWSTGANSQSIVVKDSGAYMVRVTDVNGCTGPSPVAVVSFFATAKPFVTQAGTVLTSSSAQSYQWYQNDSLISGATNETYTIMYSGVYKVRIKDGNGCNAESDTIFVDVSSGTSVVTVVGLSCLAANTFNAGEIVSIPLELLSSKNLSGNPAQYRAQIRYQRDVLSPQFSAESISINGNENVVTILGLRDATLTSGRLLELPFKVMLGSAPCATVHLDTLIWLDGKAGVSVQNQDCEICVNVCRQGGTRLFSSGGKVQLFQNQPNPFNAQTVIRYELIEKGPTSLTVSDMLGRRMATLVDETKDAGVYEARFDATTMASGMYFCILQTPTMQSIRLMQVLK